MNKILTVSIAAYNAEKYIEKALNSLLDPSINDRIEILVCDDGGSDRTLQIVERYAQKYPGTVVPVRKENGGYGSVYNTNIPRATGKYFKILDADDWFVKENFVKFVELLSRIDADYVVSDTCDFYEKYGTYRPFQYCGHIQEDQYAFEEVDFQKAVIGMNGSTYRTSILQALPKPFSEKFYIDSELVVYCAPYLKTVYFWHHVLYIYQHGRAEASTNISSVKKHYKEHEAVFENILADYLRLREDSSSRKIYVRNYIVFMAAEFYQFLSAFTPSKQNYDEMCAYREKLREKCPEIIYLLKQKKNYYANLFLRFGLAAYPFLHPLLLMINGMKNFRHKHYKGQEALLEEKQSS